MQPTIILIGSFNPAQDEAVNRVVSLQDGEPTLRRVDATKLLAEMYLPRDRNDPEREEFAKQVTESLEEHFGQFTDVTVLMIAEATYESWDRGAFDIFYHYITQRFRDLEMWVIQSRGTLYET